MSRKDWLSDDRGASAPRAPENATAATPAPEKAADAAVGAATTNRAARESAGVPLMQVPPSLGTGHGRGEYSPVEEVQFERAGSRADELVAIRYERHETLVAMGDCRGHDLTYAIRTRFRARWFRAGP